MPQASPAPGAQAFGRRPIDPTQALQVNRGRDRAGVTEQRADLGKRMPVAMKAGGVEVAQTVRMDPLRDAGTISETRQQGADVARLDRGSLRRAKQSPW